VYGGDFFATPRSEWTPGTLQERQTTKVFPINRGIG